MEKAGEPNTVMCPRIRVKNRDFRSLRDKTRSCECVCPGARSVDRAAFGRSMSCLVVWGFCRVEGGAWLRPARSFSRGCFGTHGPSIESRLTVGMQAIDKAGILSTQARGLGDVYVHHA